MLPYYANSLYKCKVLFSTDPHRRSPKAFLTLARVQLHSDRACLACVAVRVVMGVGRVLAEQFSLGSSQPKPWAGRRKHIADGPEGAASRGANKAKVDTPRLSAAARVVILGGPSSSHGPFFSREAASVESGQCFVRTIAEDAVGALFAGAEIHGAVFFGGVGNGGEVGALVRSVTKGLRFALTAGAPVVGFTCDDGDG